VCLLVVSLLVFVCADAGHAADKSLVAPGFEAAGPGMLKRPDLIVVKCWQDKRCRFTCRFKNNGPGPIPSAQHASAEAHISAGSANPKIHNPISLKVIDPTGKLKSAGGWVDYVSHCIAKKASKGLVWIDTNKKITETSEINNGDEPVLTECN